MVNGKIVLIHGTQPTTHILKPMIEDISESVQNEFFCMRLANLMGINTPNVDIGRLGDTPYFLVERYDRVLAENKIIRLHQEDFCQALSIMPENKYENEGGPGIAQSLNLIADKSTKPTKDRRKLLEMIIFNYLIANADAHAKNFSLLYSNKKPELAPAYDLLCTEVYPQITLKMAMKIGSKYDPYAICAEHWHHIVPDVAVARNEIDEFLMQMSKGCVGQAQLLRESLRKDGIVAPVFDKIVKIIEKRASVIAKL